MAKAPTYRQGQQDTITSLLNTLRETGLPVDQSLDQVMNLIAQTAGVDSPTKEQVKVLKMADSMLGKNTRLQMQILARQGKLAEASQTALNQLQKMREQGRLGKVKMRSQAEIDMEARKFASEEKDKTAARKANEILETEKAKVQAEIDTGKMRAEAALANMTPVDRALREQSESMLAKLQASSEIPAELRNPETLTKLVPDEGIRRQVEAVMGLRSAQAGAAAEDAARAAGLTAPEVVTALRQQAQATGMTLTNKELDAGRKIQNLMLGLPTRAQQVGLALQAGEIPGSGSPLQPTGGLRMLPGLGQAGVREASPAFAALGNAISKLDAEAAETAATSAFSMLKKAPGNALARLGAGAGGILALILGSKLLGKDKGEQEMPPAMQLLMQQQMQQQANQQQLTESLVNSRGAGAELNSARAQLMRMQMLQLAGGGGQGGLV